MLKPKQKDNIRHIYLLNKDEMTKGEIIDEILLLYPTFDRDEVDDYLESTYYLIDSI